MAVLKSESLAKRSYQCGIYSDGTPQYCNDSWNNWGRWVAFVAILVAAFIVFFLLACLSARRRRRVGATPYYGTGWVGRAPFGYGQAQYGQQQPPYGNQNQYQQQPYNSNQAPPYSPPQEQDFYGGQNQGYYGGQQTGVELQQPQNTFQNQRGGDSVYEPPAGPPPTKGDGIVR